MFKVINGGEAKCSISLLGLAKTPPFIPLNSLEYLLRCSQKICYFSCSFLRHLLLTIVKDRQQIDWVLPNVLSFLCATVRGTAGASVGDLRLV